MSMTLISTVTVGSGGAATIDFNSIPQTFTDLLILCSARTTQSLEDDLRVRFNSDTASNYPFRSLFGTGTGSGSGNGTLNFAYLGAISGTAFTANTFANQSGYIPNYTGSSSKTLSTDSVSENNGTGATQLLVASRWTGTAAITTVTLSGASANLAQHSTASLYGITRGSGGATVS